MTIYEFLTAMTTAGIVGGFLFLCCVVLGATEALARWLWK